MRIGLYGGTFDPIHLGHLVLAECCREQAQLDQVWFLPAAAPPHKPDTATPAEQRAEMTELGTAGHLQFRVDRTELKRSGRSYTVDTLRTLAEQRPDCEFLLLMGADAVHDLPEWRQPEVILELAQIVAVNRSGHKPLELNQLPAIGAQNMADRVQIVSMPEIAISSSEIRERIRSGRSIRYLVPRAVEVFIESHAVYPSVNPPAPD